LINAILRGPARDVSNLFDKIPSLGIELVGQIGRLKNWLHKLFTFAKPDRQRGPVGAVRFWRANRIHFAGCLLRGFS